MSGAAPAPAGRPSGRGKIRNQRALFCPPATRRPAERPHPLHIIERVPTYEYRCKNGHQFEVIQSMSDDPVAVCEVCGAPVERVFHPVAVHFKGSGFYNTDYGKKKSAAGSDGKPESSGGESKKADSVSSSSSSSSSSSKDSSEKPATKSSD